MPMCAGELESWIDRINEELAGLLQRYKSEQYICEICLKHADHLMKSIRYELEKEKKDAPAE